MTQFITQNNLKSWLDALAQERTLIAPKQVAEMVLYKPVSSSAEIAWAYERPNMSPKEYTWPATETTLRVLPRFYFLFPPPGPRSGLAPGPPFGPGGFSQLVPGPPSGPGGLLSMSGLLA